jgi:archaellum component FlaC
MSPTKKQKKQIEANRNKLAKLRQMLAGAKQQLDDPSEVERLETEIAGIEEQNRQLRQS